MLGGAAALVVLGLQNKKPEDLYTSNTNTTITLTLTLTLTLTDKKPEDRTPANPNTTLTLTLTDKKPEDRTPADISCLVAATSPCLFVQQLAPKVHESLCRVMRISTLPAERLVCSQASECRMRMPSENGKTPNANA